MRIGEAIEQAKKLTGSVVDDASLALWLRDYDASLLLLGYGERPEDASEDELLLPAPWDGVYVRYLEAMTYYTRQEYERYQNARVMAENALAQYKAYYRREHAPEQRAERRVW